MAEDMGMDEFSCRFFAARDAGWPYVCVRCGGGIGQNTSDHAADCPFLDPERLRLMEPVAAVAPTERVEVAPGSDLEAGVEIRVVARTATRGVRDELYGCFTRMREIAPQGAFDWCLLDSVGNRIATDV